MMAGCCGPSTSFATEYEARIAPWPIGTARATPYCLNLQSPATTPYLFSSYAKPTSATPKLKPPLTVQPVSFLPCVVNSLWRSYAAPTRSLPPMPAQWIEPEYSDGSAAVVVPPGTPAGGELDLL